MDLFEQYRRIAEVSGLEDVELEDSFTEMRNPSSEKNLEVAYSDGDYKVTFAETWGVSETEYEMTVEQRGGEGTWKEVESSAYTAEDHAGRLIAMQEMKQDVNSILEPEAS